MKQRLHPIELTLMIVAALALTSGAVALHTQSQLAEKVVRLHVLANSDSEEDQALKLQVRDAVLEQATETLRGADSQTEACRRLTAILPELEETARAVITANGYDYSVRAELAIEAWNRDVCEYGDAAYPKEGKRLLKEVPISKDTPLTPELLAWLLGSENGARKDISGRSFFVVLNQADTSERREDGRKVLDILKHSYGIQGILTSFSGTERNQE